MEPLIGIRPPRSIREVFDRLPEGTLAQLIENQLILTPSPTDNHQRILHTISVRIFNYLEKTPIDLVRIAPMTFFWMNKMYFNRISFLSKMKKQIPSGLTAYIPLLIWSLKFYPPLLFNMTSTRKKAYMNGLA